MLNDALHCIILASTLVEMQHDARIDSDPILVFPFVAFLHLVVEISNLLSNKFVCFAN